jgi:medium-chain acyl-[acyl-carrier-protein] hydrolase
MFRDWGPALTGAIEVCPVSLPGREDRLAEAPFTRLTPLVDALAHELVPHMRTRAAFFGHSLGALVAFEVARRLRSTRGLLPVHLFVSASLPPESVNRQRRLHQLPRTELVRELRRFEGTPPELLESDEFVELILPTLRADLAIVETYVYEDDTELECPISVFGGVADRTVTPEKLLGWRAHTSGIFALRTYPGGHFFLHEAQAAVLGAVSADLFQSAQPAAATTSRTIAGR